MFRTAAAIALLLLLSALTFAHPPTGIVVDRQGRIYFSDLEAIWRLTPDGKLSVFRAAVTGRHVHELFMDREGNVYGSDISYDPSSQKFTGSVWKMSPTAELTWLQPPTNNTPRGISNWIDRLGNMYSIDQNNHTKTRTLLLRRAPDGTVVTLAGGAYGHADGQGAAAKFSSVGALTFGPDGNLYLTDGSAVRKVTLDGRVTTVARNLDQSALTDQDKRSGNQGGLTGLAVDVLGNSYVADTGHRRLIKVAPDGKMDVIYRAEAPFFPNGVYAGHDGSIYILEIGLTPPSTHTGPRVTKISPDGKSAALVTLGEQPPEVSEHSSAVVGTGGIQAVAGGISRNRLFLGAGLTAGAMLIAVAWWRKRHRTQLT